MDIGLLEDFVVLCGELNFSAAAGRRNMTQPAFSRRIKALEEWVGTPLFQRTSRSVVLTPAGRMLFPRVEAMLRDLRQAREETLEVAGKAAKSLTIASTHALSFTFVPRWMAQTVNLATFGAINHISDSYAECEALLLRGLAPFLICHVHPTATTHLSGRHIHSLHIGEDRLIPLAQPGPDGAPRWAANRVRGGEAMPYLAYSQQSGLGRILEAEWRERRRPNLRAVFHSHLCATLKEVAKDGQGIAWVPLSLAEGDLSAGVLVRAGPPEFDVPVEIRLFRLASRLGRHAEQFWETASSQAGA